MTRQRHGNTLGLAVFALALAETLRRQPLIHTHSVPSLNGADIPEM